MLIATSSEPIITGAMWVAAALVAAGGLYTRLKGWWS